MDGEQAGLSQSLQFRLARAISLAVAAMATVAGILSFRATLHEVHEFQDEILEPSCWDRNPVRPPHRCQCRAVCRPMTTRKG